MIQETEKLDRIAIFICTNKRKDLHWKGTVYMFKIDFNIEVTGNGINFYILSSILIKVFSCDANLKAASLKNLHAGRAIQI